MQENIVTVFIIHADFILFIRGAEKTWSQKTKIKKLRKCFEKPESKQRRLQRQTDCARVITSLYKSDRWLYCIVLSIVTQSSYSTRGDLGKGQSRWNYGKALRAWSPLHLLYAHNVLVHTSYAAGNIETHLYWRTTKLKSTSKLIFFLYMCKPGK